MSTLGRVKWFNSRDGYGFITSLDSNEDIFVHQSNVCPKINRYRSLTNGEYVSFDITKDDNEVSQAVNVTGVNGGPLLCDAHLEMDDEGNVSRVGPPIGFRSGGRGGGRGGRGRGRGAQNKESSEESS